MPAPTTEAPTTTAEVEPNAPSSQAPPQQGALTAWGFTRLALYPNSVALPYSRTELDPETQTSLYYDTAGAPVEMGKHGTNNATAQSTSTGSDGGGSQPPAPSDSDVIEDTESD
ncbi:putative ATP-grasp-modified RiPP [Streptomyces sp. BPTC-684]|uniref:putative ATP-grasp-modified RiPP n=1 Tax=Streptomyces sp. BPTC-684 TaxID=3043734 RepID=UPI0024B237F7|nr:putative ATP-grasp-modified RiPP [Streptomyces sp. BPTC-684]WHM36330.1 putative ATP-grasp-modified RiPP [Streptomyces sp. BPTC-684]